MPSEKDKGRKQKKGKKLTYIETKGVHLHQHLASEENDEEEVSVFLQQKIALPSLTFAWCNKHRHTVCKVCQVP